MIAKNGLLEGLLEQAQEHHTRVTQMLCQVPSELPEYEELVVRESLLAEKIKQLKGQLGI